MLIRFEKVTHTKEKLSFTVSLEGISFLVEKWYAIGGAKSFSEFNGNQSLLYNTSHGNDYTPLMKAIIIAIDAYIDGVSHGEHFFHYEESKDVSI